MLTDEIFHNLLRLFHLSTAPCRCYDGLNCPLVHGPTPKAAPTPTPKASCVGWREHLQEKHGKASYGCFLSHGRTPLHHPVVMDHEFVLKPMVTWGSPILRNPQIEVWNNGKRNGCDWANAILYVLWKNKHGKNGINVVDPPISLTNHPNTRKEWYKSSRIGGSFDLTATSLDGEGESPNGFDSGWWITIRILVNY